MTLYYINALRLYGGIVMNLRESGKISLSCQVGSMIKYFSIIDG
jgi:hypothetical protein